MSLSTKFADEMMKRKIKSLFSITLLALLIGASVCSTAWGDIYEFQPNRYDLYDLDHWRHYTWGIDWDIPEGRMIVGASLSLDHIRNWNNRPNDLWIHLLDSARPGVTVGRDNQWRAVNFFSDVDGTQLAHYEDLGTTPVNLKYSFDEEDHDARAPTHWGAKLTALNTYLADGNVGLGFDPDCHYWNNGITLSIETATIPTPLPPAAFLFPFGLAIFGVYRWRKREK